MEPMAPDKPEYRVYRARRGILSRLLNRRESARFDTLRTEDGAAPPPGAKGGLGTVPPPPEREGMLPRRTFRPERPRREISWRRVLAWVVGAIAAWTVLSLALFFWSAHQQSQKLSPRTPCRLHNAANM